MTKHYEALLRAYTFLENTTPLRYDCGTLCGAYCCQNNAEEGETMGMWLLPFEKELLTALDEDIERKHYTFDEAKDGTKTVYCNGSCLRAFRPFACRIYPFYAHIGKKQDGRIKISIKRDPRAKLSCPIAMTTSYLRPTVEFLTAVQAAVRELMKDEIIAKDIIEMSEFLSEIEEMQNKLLG